MQANPYQPWLHRFAVLTACAALLPIVVGALVTTLDAGMAFHDWPSSDGQNMFLYPWLQSAGEKFIEHGHRLAGALIGMLSIVLAGLTWWKEPRRWVRVTATLILLAVIGQGILGGQRVLRDERLLAMVHSGFAALVFSLMAALALFTGQRWLFLGHQVRDCHISRLKPLALLAPALIFFQYMLGGALRHLHTVLHAHVVFALVVLSFVVVTAIVAHRTRNSWLVRPAWLLVILVVVQISLGAGAWVTTLGVPQWASALHLLPRGYVAVENSDLQIVLRTGHAVVGMLVLMTSIILALRVFRLDSLRAERGGSQDRTDRIIPPPPVQGDVG